VQIAGVVSAFGIGQEAQAATALLLTRSCDSETGIGAVFGEVSPYDLRGVETLLGWQLHMRFTSNPTGGWATMSRT
jgi:hypothetical protein